MKKGAAEAPVVFEEGGSLHGRLRLASAGLQFFGKEDCRVSTVFSCSHRENMAIAGVTLRDFSRVNQ